MLWRKNFIKTFVERDIPQLGFRKPDWKYSFYRTSNGAEIDLIIEYKQKKIAVEFKCSKSPKISRGFYQAVADLDIDNAWCVIPSEGSYPSEKLTIAGLGDFINYMDHL